MKISQVAAQLYTLRNECKTENDIARSLRRVREIGYQAVQVSGLGPISDPKLVQLCHDNDLTICATHESLAALLDTPDEIIEHLRNLGCKHTALGSPGGVDLGSLEGVLDFCRRVEVSAEKFARAGLTLSHHNHHVEFRKLGEKTVLEIIRENTRFLGFEIDTYWVQYGGANPESLVKSVAGRSPLLHLKDYAIDKENTPVFAEIGQGNLEFPAIISQAEIGGCEWFIVEQDTTPGDPFDSLQISFEYVRDYLCV